MSKTKNSGVVSKLSSNATSLSSHTEHQLAILLHQESDPTPGRHQETTAMSRGESSTVESTQPSQSPQPGPGPSPVQLSPQQPQSTSADEHPDSSSLSPRKPGENAILKQLLSQDDDEDNPSSPSGDKKDKGDGEKNEAEAKKTHPNKLLKVSPPPLEIGLCCALQIGDWVGCLDIRSFTVSEAWKTHPNKLLKVSPPPS